MIGNQTIPGVKELLDAAVALRPREELFDIRTDPSCMDNLAGQANQKDVIEKLSKRLEKYLTETGDLRVTDPKAAHQWEMYPRYSSLRWFPEPVWWSETSKRVPPQPWLESRRPRVKQGE